MDEVYFPSPVSHHSGYIRDDSRTSQSYIDNAPGRQMGFRRFVTLTNTPISLRRSRTQSPPRIDRSLIADLDEVAPLTDLKPRFVRNRLHSPVISPRRRLYSHFGYPSNFAYPDHFPVSDLRRLLTSDAVLEGAIDAFPLSSPDGFTESTFVSFLFLFVAPEIHEPLVRYIFRLFTEFERLQGQPLHLAIRVLLQLSLQTQALAPPASLLPLPLNALTHLQVVVSDEGECHQAMARLAALRGQPLTPDLDLAAAHLLLMDLYVQHLGLWAVLHIDLPSLHRLFSQLDQNTVSMMELQPMLHSALTILSDQIRIHNDEHRSGRQHLLQTSTWRSPSCAWAGLLKDQPLLSLREALMALHTEMPEGLVLKHVLPRELAAYQHNKAIVRTALDQHVSIQLFSSGVLQHMDTALANDHTLGPWKPYLKLLCSSLDNLDNVQTQCYRNEPHPHPTPLLTYAPGQVICWYAPVLVSTAPITEYLSSPTGGMVFEIEMGSAKCLPDEPTSPYAILKACSWFETISVQQQGDLWRVQMREIPPSWTLMDELSQEAVLWRWYEKGRWHSYDRQTSLQLENGTHALTTGGPSELRIGDNVVDLLQMTQTRVCRVDRQTFPTHPTLPYIVTPTLVCTVPLGVDIAESLRVWCWLDSDGTWHEYDHHHTKRLDSKWLRGKELFTVGDLVFDTKQMTQSHTHDPRVECRIGFLVYAWWWQDYTQQERQDGTLTPTGPWVPFPRDTMKVLEFAWIARQPVVHQLMCGMDPVRLLDVDMLKLVGRQCDNPFRQHSLLRGGPELRNDPGFVVDSSALGMHHTPPYWSKMHGHHAQRRALNHNTEPLVRDIIQLVANTTTATLHDDKFPATTTPPMRLQVHTVEIVQNLSLWRDYTCQRAALLHAYGTGCAAFDGSHHLRTHPLRLPALDTTLNEQYLWHGCPAEAINVLTEKSIDPRFGDGWHAQGLRFTDFSSLANMEVGCGRCGVVGPQCHCPQQLHYIILCRVTLGKMKVSHLTDQLLDGCDSLITMDGRQVRVRHPEQVYPEFIVGYSRSPLHIHPHPFRL
eukprot:NODE_93_length_3284_cov_24.873931_g86_i0.p1 GENE.NODE_93_length_3284_cov_24.873931_g86_i0~~NODE_93_length_3284_cov_24.873931_g86_i0.p1  ORF type:complete len:1072 (+),score=232.80 NODE_93_length_3284_cov_24.873931_g86_i0:71-3217(+)